MRVVISREKIRTQNIKWYLMLTPLIKTNGFIEHYSILSKLNNVFALLSIMVLLYILIRRIKKVNQTNRVLLLALMTFYGYIIARTSRMHGFYDFNAILFPAVYCLGISLYITILAGKPLLLVKSFLINLEVNVYINLLTLLIFPGGLYLTGSGKGKCWFLGYDNWWFIFFYITYFFAFVHYNITGKWARFVLLLVAIHVSTLITMSGVLIFGTLFMDFMLVTKAYKAKIMNVKTVIMAAVIINAMLIFSYASGLIVFVVNVLQRPIATLLVRNRIWKITLQAISDYLLLGNGRPSPQFRINMYGLTSGVNAHNMWLEILYEAGVVGSAIFALLVILVGRKLRKVADADNKQALLLCLLTCLIGLSVDSVLLELRGNLFFALLFIAGSLNSYLPKDNVSARGLIKHKRLKIYLRNKKL